MTGYWVYLYVTRTYINLFFKQISCLLQHENTTNKSFVSFGNVSSLWKINMPKAFAIHLWSAKMIFPNKSSKSRMIYCLPSCSLSFRSIYYYCWIRLTSRSIIWKATEVAIGSNWLFFENRAHRSKLSNSSVVNIWRRNQLCQR